MLRAFPARRPEVTWAFRPQGPGRRVCAAILALVVGSVVLAPLPVLAAADTDTAACANVLSQPVEPTELLDIKGQKDNGDGTITLTYFLHNIQGAGGNGTDIQYQNCVWIDTNKNGIHEAGETLFGRLETRSSSSPEYFHPTLNTTVSAFLGETVCARAGEHGTLQPGGQFGAVNAAICQVLTVGRPAPRTPAAPPATNGSSSGAHTQPSINDVLRTPDQVSLNPLDMLRSAVLAAGLLILIAFPSQLFNSTLQAHYDEVMGWFGFLRRRKYRDPAPPPAEGELPPRTAIWKIALVFVFAALCGALLDPKFGPDLASLEAVLGALLAILVTTFVYTTVSALLVRRWHKRLGRMKVFRGGIVIAVLCVTLSRLTRAEPGYMYGVMISYSLGNFKMPKEHDGRLVAIGSLVVVVASLASWFAWGAIKPAAPASAPVPLVVVATALSAVFLGGMTSLIFGLLPLRFLDGSKLLSWRRVLWAIFFGVGMWLFVHVVLNAAAGAAKPDRPYLLTIGLFSAFGLVSVALWLYFRLRPEPAIEAIEEAAPIAAAPRRRKRSEMRGDVPASPDVPLDTPAEAGAEHGAVGGGSEGAAGG